MKKKQIKQQFADNDQPATKGDIIKLEQATRGDIRKLEQATKSDIRKLRKEFKDDLKKFATKDDLKKYATKEELDEWITRLYEAMMTKEDGIQLENRLMGKLDNIVFAIEEMRTESAAHFSAYERLEDWHKNHEMRIARLEGHLQAAR